MKSIPLNCFCGSPAKPGSNATIYGREYGNGMAFICTRFPTCRGYVGRHPDGRPLGTIVDQETKKLRMKVHALIDPLWKDATNGRSKKRNRGSVYGWMRRIMDEGKDFHCGELSREQCLKALELIPKNPYRPHGVIGVDLGSSDGDVTVYRKICEDGSIEITEIDHKPFKNEKEWFMNKATKETDKLRGI